MEFMITLYKYLRESIFDDEILDNSASNIINNELKELDALIADKPGPPQYGKSPSSSSIKDDTLFLLDTKYKCIDTKIYDKIKDIKDITGFTNIRTKGLIRFDIPNIDSSLCDEVNCEQVVLSKNVKLVKDVLFAFARNDSVGVDYLGQPLEPLESRGSHVSFKNVEFRCDPKSVGYRGLAFTFRNIPTFQNCYNSEGIKKIYIWGPDVFKDQEIIKKFNNFLDNKHISNYQDGKIADKYHERKSDLKTLITTIKMQKKYIFSSSETDKCFGIKSNAKLKDILDIEGFKDLNLISFTDRNVLINFRKDLGNAVNNKFNCVKLPNDEWYMEVKKF